MSTTPTPGAPHRAGRPLPWSTRCDLGRPGERHLWARHASIGTALDAALDATSPRREGRLGSVWVEDAAGAMVAGPFRHDGVRPTREWRRDPAAASARPRFVLLTDRLADEEDGGRVHPLHFIYLHGRLEDEVGFDLLASERPLGDLVGGRAALEAPVVVRDVGGRRHPALAFLWHARLGAGAAPTTILRGLVCAVDDVACITVARAAMRRRASRL